MRQTFTIKKIREMILKVKLIQLQFTIKVENLVVVNLNILDMFIAFISNILVSN